MYGNFDKAIQLMFIILCVSVPLGLWKIIDLLIILKSHIHWD